MSQEKINEKEWDTWDGDNLIIEDTIQKENIPFYQYSEFENVKLINGNVYKAIFKISQKTIALKCVSLNNKFTLDNLINEVKRHRKLEIHDSILKLYGITKQEDTNEYMIILEYANEGSLRQYLKTNFRNMQNGEPKIKPGPPFVDVSADINVFIKDLFEFFISLHNKQFEEMRLLMIKNYIREHKKNPVEILYEMISHHLFTCLIGYFYEYGIGTVADKQMAFKFYNLAANEIETSFSNPSSSRKQYNISNKEIGTASLAYMYLDGLGVEKDTKKAFQIFYKLAAKGSLLALNPIAYCYDEGIGVEKNEEKAFELYLKSAEKGSLAAQNNVRVCYECGIGITKDEAKGFQWIIKSAVAGNIDAMYNAGCFYNNGIGVDKDEKEAFKWFLKAAEKGFSLSQHYLGKYFKYGYGTNVDQKKAFEWFKKAAENDHADSQYRLGECFYEGCGTQKDIIKAVYWLNKANGNGNTYAEGLLEDIIYSIMYY
ncbi:hypothetical protein Glove_320g194 [Diversispora epigaea]|uniref:Protein kinase domain-containing protein n=1 Tax=Diversispora epigaea TaxID=1348612 RepID=A0A397HNJ8_9GLOM|nr:hypothetical protein Glove_320g194 [Diversispora epigaea]